VTWARLTSKQRQHFLINLSANTGWKSIESNARGRKTIGILFMARAKRARLRAKKAELAPPNCQRQTTVVRTVATIVGTTTLLATALGIWFSQPQLSISPRIPLSETEIDTPFSITNDGLWALDEVQSTCSLKHVVLVGNVVLDADRLTVGPVASALKRGEQTTVVCRGISVRIPIIGADVSIAVSFRTWVPPWKHELTQRFDAARDKTGVLKWSPRASIR